MRRAVLFESGIWEKFQRAARQRRRNPVNVLAQYMRQSVEIWEDQKLDEEIRREARRSGLREEQAVDIVREYRAQKAAPCARS